MNTCSKSVGNVGSISTVSVYVSSGTGGDIYFLARSVESNERCTMSATAGSSSGTGIEGGNVSFTAYSSTSGVGGNSQLDSGTSVSHAGGNLIETSGS